MGGGHSEVEETVEEWGGHGLWETWLWNGAQVVGWCMRVGWRVGRSGKGSDYDTMGRVTGGFGERGVWEGEWEGVWEGRDCDTVGRVTGGFGERGVWGRSVWEGEGLREGLERGGCVGRGVERGRCMGVERLRF
jgi:hypothetical protein